MVEVRYTQDGMVKRIFMLNLTIEQFTRHYHHKVIPNYQSILQLIRKFFLTCRSPPPESNRLRNYVAN